MRFRRPTLNLISSGISTVPILKRSSVGGSATVTLNPTRLNRLDRPSWSRRGWSASSSRHQQRTPTTYHAPSRNDPTLPVMRFRRSEPAHPRPIRTPIRLLPRQPWSRYSRQVRAGDIGTRGPTTSSVPFVSPPVSLLLPFRPSRTDREPSADTPGDAYLWPPATR